MCFTLMGCQKENSGNSTETKPVENLDIAEVVDQENVENSFTVNLRQSTGGANTATVYADILGSAGDKYAYTLTYSANGETHTTSEYGLDTDISSGTQVIEVLNLDCTEHESEVGLNVEDGSEIFVTVRKIGADEVVKSNSITFRKVGLVD